MRITINEISGDGTVVHFTHDSGAADGVWLGQRAPQLGETEVDWSIPGRFWWQDDLRVRPASGGVVDLTDESRPVVGTAVAFDDRGVLTLRIGDSQVQVDTNGKAPQQLIGEIIEVDSMLIELTPAGER
jgi:hypothetical protein